MESNLAELLRKLVQFLNILFNIGTIQDREEWFPFRKLKYAVDPTVLLSIKTAELFQLTSKTLTSER
jgi:hypothetical protein